MPSKKTKRTSDLSVPKKSATELISKAGPSHKPAQPEIKGKDTGEMPLNKFVSHAGVCSRRDAVDLVKSGKVSVNGQVITEPGHKVKKCGRQQDTGQENFSQ